MRFNYFFYLIYRFSYNLKYLGVNKTLKKTYDYITKKNSANYSNYIFYTNKNTFDFFINYRRDIKHQYLNHIKLFNFESIYKSNDRSLIFSNFELVNESIKKKILNFRSVLILKLEYADYVKLSTKQKQFIDFIFFLNSNSKIKKQIDFHGYFLANYDNWPLYLDRFFQIFLKEKLMMIPIIRGPKLLNNSYFEKPKTIYLKLDFTSYSIDINKTSKFENLVNNLKIEDLEYLYVSEDLYWSYNALLQVNDFNNLNFRIFLKHSLGNAVIFKKI